MPFSTTAQVRFADVDPAGIVFYPRYFEMLNGAVEDWFAQSLGVDFATMHLTRKMGVPTVKLEAEFAAPSRLGEVLAITVQPGTPGRTSCPVTIAFSNNGELRLRVNVVLVCMDLEKHRSMPWPDDLRNALTAQAEVAAPA
ncbi:acyl-CoA thioesterase [Aurantiacibacter suaedae]|uniref:acyl-CoA thioesterase n=1 Tax=Aurantiacibacter suaedae TaxID=2545755 RepID=UPI0010F6868A|nr:thioesterase family protein [Aurantiacibacter suaedae]